jgi:hypothetical protein
MMKSSEVGWARNVARMGEKRNACRVLVAKAETRRLLKDAEADGI